MRVGDGDWDRSKGRATRRGEPGRMDWFAPEGGRSPLAVDLGVDGGQRQAGRNSAGISLREGNARGNAQGNSSCEGRSSQDTWEGAELLVAVREFVEEEAAGDEGAGRLRGGGEAG